jgi:dynein heavy chain
MEEFQNFSQHLEKDAPARFRDWFNDLAPEIMPLPLEWKKLADHSFQKLLILRCMRPDRLTNAMTIFMRKALPDGDKFCDMDQENSF